jgi:hypothetical protein
VEFKGLGVKLQIYLEFLKLFLNRNINGLGLQVVYHSGAQSKVDRSPWPAVKLTGAQPYDRSGHWEAATMAQAVGREYTEAYW